MIKVSGLKKAYQLGEQKIRALNGVDVDIAEGEFVAVMGSSGSGKSTFMNMVGCLDKPTQGEISLEGERLSDLSVEQLASVRNQKIGFVFQQFNLLARTNALENVMLPLFYSDVDKVEWAGRAKECLEQVGLSDRLSHDPSQLSGGQQQRVAIARAMVNSPRIILADEPTGALDTETGLGVMELFQKLNANGITLMVVTHEPDIAAFAQRQLIFRDGVLISDQRSKPSDAAQMLREFRLERSLKLAH
ncbi:MAG TPA: macrolide ABC transporter ATP-binding protein [Porticoccaceae bacterium]|nr:macrolide ABC transporter ATP-binding protein [Porticoccaceae bacterium]